MDTYTSSNHAFELRTALIKLQKHENALNENIRHWENKATTAERDQQWDLADIARKKIDTAKTQRDAITKQIATYRKTLGQFDARVSQRIDTRLADVNVPQRPQPSLDPNLALLEEIEADFNKIRSLSDKLAPKIAKLKLRLDVLHQQSSMSIDDELELLKQQIMGMQ